MAAKKKAPKKQLTNGATVVAEIPPLNEQILELEVVGISPLLCNQFSQKAKQEMLDKMQGKAKNKKPPKDPEADFRASLYEHPDGGYGFPSTGFKNAAVSACRNVSGIPMTLARGAFFVLDELVKIEGEPVMDERYARVKMSTDIRHRGRFDEWTATVPVSYNADVMTAEQIVNLFNQAGYSVGIGDWRPERNGPYGRFRIATSDD
jgi:hypothetical protein